MKQLEKDILEEVNSLLALERPRLRRCGLEPSPPEIARSNETGEAYTSELVVELRRGGEIEDILEFFIFKDGEPNLSVEEAAGWLASELQSLGKV